MRILPFLSMLCVLTAPFCCAQDAPKAPTAEPRADVLVFSNGDRLSGKLQSAADGKIVFHSDMAGDLTVSFSKVKELRSESEFVALRSAKPGNYKAAATGTVSFVGDEVTLTRSAATGQGTVQTLPTKDLGYLVRLAEYVNDVEHRAGFRQGWVGSATAGVTLVRSTESSTTLTGSLHFVRQLPMVAYLPLHDRTTLNVSETYGTSRSPVIPPTFPPTPATQVQTSIFHADAERDQYFEPRLYVLADTTFDHNFASGLQLQQVYGTGVGWTAVQQPRQQIDVKADLHFERQQFLQTQSTPPPANTELVGSTFQENYRRILPLKVVITEWANFSPAWNDFVAYSANAYIGVALPLHKRINVSLSATDNYINNPAEYYRTNTVQFVTGMTYTFQ